MRLPFLPALAVAVLTGCGSSRPASPDAETAAYVTRLGADTVAAEVVRRTAARVEADVVVRSPRTTRTRYALDLGPDGTFRRFEAVTHATGGGAPTRTETAVPVGDSLRVTVTEDGASRARTFAGDPRALPFVDLVHWPLALAAERAHARGGADVAQPLFTDRALLPFRLGNGPDGAVTVTHPTRGTMTAEVDARGRLQRLDAGATTRKVTVTRTASVDVDALERRFAARAAAGAAFGPLSGRGTTTARIRGATITVDYGRPAKRGRDVFGGLVRWGDLWRTGANQATHFETDRPLVLGGLRVPAGRYTLYSIPEPGGGTLIVNRQTGQNGTQYDAGRDLGRVPMTAAALAEPVELFTIAVEEAAAGGVLRLLWDRTVLAVPFVVAE